MALDGNFADHHGIDARRVMDHIAFLDASIRELSSAITERLTEFEPAIALLCEMPGWGRATAEVFIAETGGDRRACGRFDLVDLGDGQRRLYIGYVSPIRRFA